jgi:hypothetical protein
MSSRSRSAVDITAKFIDVAMKQHGGQRLALSHSGWQTLCARNTPAHVTGLSHWTRCLPDHGWMRERRIVRFKWDWVLGVDPHCAPTVTTRTPRVVTVMSVAARRDNCLRASG